MARITLYYDRDGNGTGRTVIVRGLEEDADGEGDRYLWDLSGMDAGVYFPHAVINDGNTRKTVYAPNAVIVGDGGGQPFISLRGPRGEEEKEPGDRVNIRWRDLDADSNARIDLAYRPVGSDKGETPIVSGLAEDPDRRDDRYRWRLPELAPGKYRIIAHISDGKWRVTDVSSGYVELEGEKGEEDDRHHRDHEEHEEDEEERGEDPGWERGKGPGWGPGRGPRWERE